MAVEPEKKDRGKDDQSSRADEEVKEGKSRACVQGCACVSVCPCPWSVEVLMSTGC